LPPGPPPPPGAPSPGMSIKPRSQNQEGYIQKGRPSPDSRSSCRLQESGLTAKVVSAVVDLARTDSPAAKEAVSRAAGHLALGEVCGDLPPGVGFAPMVPVFVALLGADQASDVQRQQLHVPPPPFCWGSLIMSGPQV